MQTVSEDRLVGKKLGDYHIEELLGRGKMSAVYMAQLTKGSAMDQAEAIAFALGESARPRPDADRPGAGPGQLTRRQRACRFCCWRCR